jgi:hypothetical protein
VIWSLEGGKQGLFSFIFDVTARLLEATSQSQFGGVSLLFRQ